jgi:hypothetical protein
MSNHGLRTTGRPNGNFGAARIQAKKETLDLTKEILAKDNLRIPDQDEAYAKLVEAYNATTDLKLKVALWDMIKRRKATLQKVKVKPSVIPDKTHWELIKLTR